MAKKNAISKTKALIDKEEKPTPEKDPELRCKTTGLKPRQEKFAILYFNGVPALTAYLELYKNVTYAAACVASYRMLRNAKVQKYIDGLRREFRQEAGWTRKDAIKQLERLMLRAEAMGDITEARHCMQEIAKMMAFYKEHNQIEANHKIIKRIYKIDKSIGMKETADQNKKSEILDAQIIEKIDLLTDE